jgi:tetratricopeptide (TPR) repeat protein
MGRAASKPSPLLRPPWHERARTPLLAGSVLFVTLLAYAPAIGGGFIWDDDDHVTNNLALRTLKGLQWIWLRPGATPQYYPLTFTSFWFQYQLWGGSAPPYRAVNLLLHAGSAVLLWRTLALLGLRGGLLAGAIFALHPVHVESVAWVSERKNTLCCFLYLLAAYVYLRSERAADGQQTKGGPRTLYLLSLIAFTGAMLSKTIACALPAVLLVVAWWRHGRIARRDLMRTFPMFVIGIALGLLTIATERTDIGASGPDWQLSFTERCLIAGRAVVFYAGKLLWPAQLSFNYERWEIRADDPWQFIFPVAVLGAVAVAAWVAWRGHRGALAAVLIYVGSLLPALGLVNVYPMRFSFVADHFQYLASMGLIALLSECAVNRLASARPAVRSSIVAIVLVALAVQTMRHSATYSSAERLWLATLASNPKSFLAHGNLGLAALERNDLEVARHHLERTVALKASAHEGYLGLATYYERTGRPEQAFAQIAEAVQRSPNSIAARMRLARALSDRGDIAGALAEYGRVLDLKPRFAPARMARADLLMSRGQAPEAEAEYRRTVELTPELYLPRVRLAVIERRRGNRPAAIDQLVAAREVGGDQPMVRSALGMLLLEAGRLPDARAEFTAALRLNPELPEARKALVEIERRERSRF